MAVAAVPLMIASAAVSVMSSMQAAKASESMGKAQQQAADHKAVLQKQAAGQEQASAQRAMIVEGRNKDLAISRVKAVGAAGGGTLTDPGMAKVIGDIDAEGEYRKLASLYQGNQRAYDLERGAEISTFSGGMSRYVGKQRAKAHKMQAVSTVLRTGASLAGKYGGSFGDSGGGGSMGGSSYNDFLDDPDAW